jgi:hypothetical protein
MFPLIPTSLLLAQHDAWLEEMRKEPLQAVGRPVRLKAHRRLLSRVGKCLVSAGLRLQARYRQEAPPTPEAAIHASEVSV